MFDITSSKLLILIVVALIVVGPKDLPLLLRTIGKYMGVMRRHAADFRAQFDEAVREAELEELRKDFESVGDEVHATMKEGVAAIDSNVESARLSVDSALEQLPAEPDVEAKSEPEPAEEPPLSEKTTT